MSTGYASPLLYATFKAAGAIGDGEMLGHVRNRYASHRQGEAVCRTPAVIT